MISMMMSVVLMQPADYSGKAAELATSAQAHIDAEEFAAAAEDFISLASLPGVDRDHADQQAHIALESAYFASSPRDIRPLCRGLDLAQRAAQNSQNDQLRQAWEEIAREDRQLLQFDGGAERCRPAIRVEMLSVEGGMQLPTADHATQRSPLRSQDERRTQAKATAGAVLVGLGAGFTALMGVALDVHRRRHDELRAVGSLPEGQTLSHDEASNLADALDEAKAARGAAIALGVTSGALLATGVGLLVSSRRSQRAVAFAPYGNLHGAGASLRMKF